MIKGIIFVMMTQGGTEVQYPAMRYFTSMEQCEQKAQEAIPMFISQLGAVSARYTCEPVEG
jgi:hypothetical protein